MPALIAMPMFWGAVAAGAGAGAGIYSANKQSSAANHAADLQVGAANHAADVQGRAAADALAFQKAEADRAQANAETTQHANYDQWAARERRMSTLGELTGLAPRQIPGYVPLSGSGDGSGGGAGAMDPRVSDIVQKATAGLPPTSQSLDTIIAALNKEGIKATRARHGVNGSLASDDKIDFGNGAGIDMIFNVGGGDARWQFNPYGPSTGAAPATATKAPYISTVGTMTQAPVRRTPAPMAVSRSPYTIGSML